MNKLENARKTINQIDQEMAALYEKRMNAVQEVLAYKKENGLPVFDASREQEVIERNLEHIQNPDYKLFYKDFLHHVMENSKDYQKTLLSEDVVAYAGVQGAFSQIMAQRLYPENRKLNLKNFDEVFKSVVEKKAQYGVIPFENTNSGSVGEVLDALLEYPVYIQGIYDLKVEQCLLGTMDATLKDIEWVYSKDQALWQAKDFLKELGVQTVSYPNTAMAAQYVASEQDKTKAAIGAKENAQLYGLKVLASQIEAHTENTTRFLVIGLEPLNKGDRFSVILSVKHQSGSLARIIEIIARYHINMESIQSRPIKGKPFEYFFFIEMDGDLNNAQACLKDIEKNCESLKVLGTYALGEENVVDATIGSLYNEQGSLVALDSVFSSLKSLDNKVLAAYAASFTGNDDFKDRVYKWVLDGNSHLHHEVIATPGGTGAVAMTIQECLDVGQTVILPEIAWGSYNLMAQMNNLSVKTYALFEEDHFNLTSFKETCEKVMKEQDKLVIVINDPCHNPTGYSLSSQEWKDVIAFLNECSKTHKVVLLNDIAYIDFAYGQKLAKEYFSVFDDISENMAVIVAFSLSKSMTSYGLRCGAAIVMAQTEDIIQELKIVFEKDARATWSNINNGAMAAFVDVMDHHLKEYDQERLQYVALLKERSDLFVKEANEVGLKHYPYKEGFFVTLSMDNTTRDAYHEALMENHIYTVKVNKGIRVAVCSLSLDKIKGLAKKMKDILDTIQ